MVCWLAPGSVRGLQIRMITIIGKSFCLVKRAIYGHKCGSALLDAPITATIVNLGTYSFNIMHAHQPSTPADFRFQTTINPNLTQAVRYWADEFDVPPAKLLEVVREVGRNVLEVRRRLST